MSKILTTQQLMGVRVEDARKPGKRVGRVRHFIFHPTECRIIGFAVKRPDAALMFHRPDVFVALDGYTISDGVIMIDEDKASSGRAACKRLGVSWDECIIWQGLPLMTENEERLGHVGDVSFNAQTGEVISLKVDKGASVDFLLGESELPVSLIEGFRIGIGENLSKASEDDFFRGAIVVSPEALALERTGGMAQKAGAQSAVVAHKVGQMKDKAVEKVTPKASEAAQKAGEAVNKGAYRLGEQLGKTRGMFSSFKEEYKRALAGDSEKEEKDDV